MPPPRAASWCRPQAGRHCNALEFFLLNWSLISGWDPVMQALAALCALVLLARSAGFVVQWLLLRVLPRMRSTLVEMEWAQRSEERRVGEEGRFRWSPYH